MNNGNGITMVDRRDARNLVKDMLSRVPRYHMDDEPDPPEVKRARLVVKRWDDRRYEAGARLGRERANRVEEVNRAILLATTRSDLRKALDAFSRWAEKVSA